MSDNGNHPTPIELAQLDQLAEKYPALAKHTREYYEEILHADQASEPAGDPWKAYTLADAYQERPPTEYLVGKMFRLPSLSIVYGAPGVMKSLLLQDLAICVASGQEWLTPAPWIANRGGSGFATKTAPAMWIDFDNGIDMTMNRFEALGRARNLPGNVPITFYSMPNPWLYADKPESIGNLAERIKAAGARLVIIDNLGNVSGDADENSAEMGKVMSQFRQLAEDTRAAIILIHHQRKGNGIPGGRAGDSLRGHSSIEASLNLAMLVERESHSEIITIKSTKVRGKDIMPFSAAFTYTDKPDSDDLLEARFFGIATEDMESDKAIENTIIEALTVCGPLNKSKLKAEVQKPLPKIGLTRIGNVIDRMTSDGKIKLGQGSVTNEKVYSL